MSITMKSSLKFILFIFELMVVMMSWRLFKLFSSSSSNNTTTKVEDEKDKDKKKNTSQTPPQPQSFQDRVQDQFIELISDFFYAIMLVTTIILFFWRAKKTITTLKKSPYEQWKDIIGTQFYEGGVEFASLTCLLLLKWPVVFKTLWYLNTEHEDKSTWAQIFYREFVEKSIKKDDKELDKLISTNNASSSNTTGASSSSSSSSPSANSKKYKSDQEWKADFRRDLQNIGFEFDKDGEISKFPPTEVMEEYQRSSRFKDLILSAGSMSPKNTNNKDDIQIKDISQHQAEQQQKQQQQTEQQQQQFKQLNPKQKSKKKKNH